MENCTNSTNCSEPFISDDLAGPVFGAFLCVMNVLLLFTMGLLSFTIAALCLSHTVCRILRILLINLLAAGFFKALFQLVFAFTALILNFSSIPSPPLQLCRFILWGFCVGSIARMYSLVGFSFIVLLIVQYSKREIKTVYIALLLASIWIISLLLNVQILIPPIYAVQYYDDVACFPRVLDADIIKPARYTFTGIWVALGGITPLVVSIMIPIMIINYVKRNTFTKDGSSYNKGMAKFSLFLVAGNLVNIVGQAVVAFSVYISEPSGVYLTYLVGLVSLIPTPIMILIFMKPARSKIKKLFCCGQQEISHLPVCSCMVKLCHDRKRCI